MIQFKGKTSPLFDHLEEITSKELLLFEIIHKKEANC